MTQKRTSLHNFFSDKNGKLAIGQPPNAPLIVWFVFAVASRFLAGNWQTLTCDISKAAIIIWALLEIYSGISPFRRVLGTIVLVFSVASLL